MSKKTEYEKLRAIWYKRLEETGFADIEQDEDNLKEWSMKRAAQNPLEIWQAKEAYYHMANRFLNEHPFKNEKERIVWEYHSNGMSNRDIVKLLRQAKLKAIKKTYVWEIINRLEHIMKTNYLHGYKESNE